MPIELWDLTTADRCDGCSAQAWIRVWVGADALRELLLCLHHFKVHGPRLLELGSVWDDQSYRINATLDVSA
jgi:hypothetical protein